MVDLPCSYDEAQLRPLVRHPDCKSTGNVCRLERSPKAEGSLYKLLRNMWRLQGIARFTIGRKCVGLKR